VGRRAAPDIARVRSAVEALARLPAAKRLAALERMRSLDGATRREIARLVAHVDDVEAFLGPPSTLGVGRRPRSALAAGRVLGRRWRLVRELDRGGQGVVWEARDVGSGERAAVKVVGRLSRKTRDRIRREVAALRWLRLPGVVRLLDDGEDRGEVWLAMELVRGAPFPGRRRARRWHDVESTALGLLETVGRIHGAGVVHGDLKPSNVLVDARGAATVLDLGLAVSLGADAWGRRLAGGTPGYVAPECLHGRTPDVRSDLYSIGVLLAEALSSDRKTDRVEAVRAADAPPRVREVIVELVSRDPDRRPPSAADVLRRIHPPPTTRRRRRWTEVELRERFAGPDRFLHLREDGAHELFVRTRGDPAAVERELANWFRAGLATLEGDLVRVGRLSIERLRDLRDPASLLAGEVADRDAKYVAVESLRAARRSLSQGNPIAALGALEAAAVAALESRETRTLSVIHSLAVETAMRTGSTREVDRALWLLERTATRNPSTSALVMIARSAAAHLRGDSAEAMRLTSGVVRKGPRSIRRLAWTVRIEAAQRFTLTRQAIEISRASQWANADGSVEARSCARRWRAWLLYRQGRCAEAASSHQRNAQRASSDAERMRDLLDAGVASLDAGYVSRAVKLAHKAAQIATTLRRPVTEVRAHLLLRDALLRSGTLRKPDLETLSAIEEVGFQAFATTARLIEATIAWRHGDHRTARGILDALPRFSVLSRAPAELLVAECLAVAAGARVARDRRTALMRRVSKTVAAPLTAQLYGLLCLGLPSETESLRRKFHQLSIRVNTRERNRMREFMSLKESAEALGIR
jgi:protein kinase-like protein